MRAPLKVHSIENRYARQTSALKILKKEPGLEYCMYSFLFADDDPTNDTATKAYRIGIATVQTG